MKKSIRLNLLWLVLASMPLAASTGTDNARDEDDDEVQLDPVTTNARLYRNPSERREAGLGTQLTAAIRFLGLIEIEQDFRRVSSVSASVKAPNENPTSDLQLGFLISAWDMVEAELIFAGEYQTRFRSRLDEGMIGLDLHDIGIKAGKLYVPFGEYYSHLASGPALEFGETRANTALIDYSVSENWELSAYVFEGRVDKENRRNQLDWGYALEWKNNNESCRFGLSYLSDLAEAEEKVIEEAQFNQRVPGISAYLLMGYERFEITIETLQALKRFHEREASTDKPTSYNAELAYFYSERMQLATRVEYNSELEDEPQWRYGVGLSYLVSNRLLFTMDYLYGQFQSRLAFDEKDRELTHVQSMSAQLALEF